MDFLPSSNVVVIENCGSSGRTTSRLTALGINHKTVHSSDEAIALSEQSNLELAIIDLELEHKSVAAVVKRIRAKNPATAILVVAGGDQQQDLFVALEAGADDFLSPTTDNSELLLRSQVAIFRSRNRPVTVLEVDDLQLDLEKRRVTRGSKVISLTPTELRILEILMKNQPLVVSRDMLCEFLWSPNWEGVTNVIEVHINRLRRKVEQSDRPRLIKTVRGRGYTIGG